MNSFSSQTMKRSWDPARVSRKPGRNWRLRLFKRSRRMSSQTFSKPCLPTSATSWQNLSVLGSSPPFQLNCKRMPPCFSNVEISWATLRAKRRFRRSTTSSRNSEAGTGQPQIELRPDRMKTAKDQPFEFAMFVSPWLVIASVMMMF